MLEALIFSNSLHSLEKNQNYLNHKLEEIISFNVNYHKNNTKNQSSLFSENNDDDLFKSINFQNLEQSEKLEMEYNAFGFYLSEHPTKLYKSLFKEKEHADVRKLVDNLEKNDNSSKKIIALISEKKVRNTKTGKQFCFLKLSDDTAEIDTICFSEVLENLNFELREGKIVFANLVLQTMKDSKKYVVTSLTDMENFNTKKKKFEVLINSKFINYEEFKNFFANSHSGDSQLFFKVIYDQQEIEIKSEELIEFNFNEISNLKNKRYFKYYTN